MRVDELNDELVCACGHRKNGHARRFTGQRGCNTEGCECLGVELPGVAGQISELLANHDYEASHCNDEGYFTDCDCGEKLNALLAAFMADNQPTAELADFDPSTSHRHGCTAYADWTNAQCGCIDELFAVAQDATIALARMADNQADAAAKALNDAADDAEFEFRSMTFYCRGENYGTSETKMHRVGEWLRDRARRLITDTDGDNQ